MARRTGKQAKSRNTKRKRAKRPTQALYEARLAAVEELVVAMVPEDELVAIATAPPEQGGFGIALETLKGWLQVIDRRWRERATGPRADRQALHTGRLDAIFTRAFQRNTEKSDEVCLKAEKLLMALDGSAAPAKIEVSGRVDVAALTPVQRRQEIEELLARRQRALAQSRKELPAVIDAVAAER